MRVTVCELPENKEQLSRQWESLLQHLEAEKSDLLLLPELIFGDWIAVSKEVDPSQKQANLEDHQRWIPRMEALTDIWVIHSRPVSQGNLFHNTAFLWHSDHGHQKIHSKSYFPEEPTFWEETVYDKEDGSFRVLEIEDLKIGVLLCTEMWFTHHARAYGQSGIDLLLCPRATGKGSVPQWIRCGQTLAVISGAYCLSSNRSGIDRHGFEWGGSGWVSAPMTGELLTTTSLEKPFTTIEIDLKKAKEAKSEYPLNVIG